MMAVFVSSAFDKKTQQKEWGETDSTTYRNDMKSFSLANVITLLASSFGTGNSAFKIPETLSPSFVLNPSMTRCGYCSLTVLVAFELTSWRSTTLCNVNERVGPCGRWEMMSASGTPRVSCKRRRSVTFCEEQACRRSGRTVFPLLRRYEFGNTSRSS
jgi:hypothetical protein